MTANILGQEKVSNKREKYSDADTIYKVVGSVDEARHGTLGY
jgi:hypothetical protein